MGCSSNGIVYRDEKRELIRCACVIKRREECDNILHTVLELSLLFDLDVKLLHSIYVHARLNDGNPVASRLLV